MHTCRRGSVKAVVKCHLLPCSVVLPPSGTQGEGGTAHTPLVATALWLRCTHCSTLAAQQATSAWGADLSALGQQHSARWVAAALTQVAAAAGRAAARQLQQQPQPQRQAQIPATMPVPLLHPAHCSSSSSRPSCTLPPQHSCSSQQQQGCTPAGLGVVGWAPQHHHPSLA